MGFISLFVRLRAARVWSMGEGERQKEMDFKMMRVPVGRKPKKSRERRS